MLSTMDEKEQEIIAEICVELSARFCFSQSTLVQDLALAEVLCL